MFNKCMYNQITFINVFSYIHSKFNDDFDLL